MTLWHYTCTDVAPRIEQDGILRPFPHPHLAAEVVWATDLDNPPATVLGLGNLTGHLTCDRMAHRFEVLDEDAFVPWHRFARRLPREVRDGFEGALGAMPRHWWVATRTVRVRPAPRQVSPSVAR